MIYHADIPNGDYIESLTIEASSSEDAYATARAYIVKAFGKDEASALVNAWASLSVPVKSGVVHFAHRRDDEGE